MSRARNIKPGFFTNGDLLECQPLARLLFAGLWCEADRRGILEDRPKSLKVKILPGDNCDVRELLTELEEHGFIRRYEADGKHCIFIPSFERHQNPHYKEVPSELPAPQGYTPTVVAFGVTEAKRQEIFDRDGRRCTECGATERLSLDHIIARSKGGTDDDDNLTTLCGRCNAAKNNREASADARANSDQRRINVGSTSPVDSPASPADSLLLIPDPLLLIPDSGSPHPETSTPPPPSAEEEHKHPRRKSDLSGFDEFYAAYPRHKAPADAERAWSKLSETERLRALIAIRDQVTWSVFADAPPDKIPYPATWLNRRSWEDEPDRLPGMPGVVSLPDGVTPERLAEIRQRRAKGWSLSDEQAAILAGVDGVPA